MKIYQLIITLTAVLCLAACRDDSIEETGTDNYIIDDDGEIIIDSISFPDWTEETHSKSAEPNYDIVFNQDEVLRIDIEISTSTWSDMQSDLSSCFGSSRPGQTSSVSTPSWFDCTLKFEDKEWYHVGVRYKGNSSLQSAYQSGNNKLSLKLDFDEFEDDYPSLTDQRFYGFKQLNLNNNYDDASLLREKVGADLFREFGLASAMTSFCVVYINHGSTTQYYGVYTLVEEVDYTVIKTQFESGSGNLYKPDGDAASFANGTYDTDEMELKTNTDSVNYSDVKSLYDIINSTTRTTDAEEWKSDVESVFDVEEFLKWLAANNTIQNWDTYGNMTHNFYLYNNPSTNLLTWIPWDNNEAFGDGKQSQPLSFSCSEVNSNWPLINYIIAQDEYKEKYETYLESFINDVFIPSELSTRYANYHTLLKEYAYAEETYYSFLRSDNEFDSAIETLKAHAQTRNDAVSSYIGND